MSSSQGIICEFVKNHWSISSKGTDQLSPNQTSNQMLTCGFSSFHTLDVPGSFWAVYFSKPVIAFSYLISSHRTRNSLYNWDKQTYFDTRQNTKKIVLQNPTKTYGFKLVAGLDYEGDNNYLRMKKIEFFGKVLSSNTCVQIMRPFISVLFYFFFLF